MTARYTQLPPFSQTPILVSAGNGPSRLPWCRCQRCARSAANEAAFDSSRRPDAHAAGAAGPPCWQKPCSPQPDRSMAVVNLGTSTLVEVVGKNLVAWYSCRLAQNIHPHAPPCKSLANGTRSRERKQTGPAIHIVKIHQPSKNSTQKQQITELG